MLDSWIGVQGSYRERGRCWLLVIEDSVVVGGVQGRSRMGRKSVTLYR